MTVAELIEELNEIENKDAQVFVLDEHQEYTEPHLNEIDEGIAIVS